MLLSYSVHQFRSSRMSFVIRKRLSPPATSVLHTSTPAKVMSCHSSANSPVNVHALYSRNNVQAQLYIPRQPPLTHHSPHVRLRLIPSACIDCDGLIADSVGISTGPVDGVDWSWPRLSRLVARSLHRCPQGSDPRCLPPCSTIRLRPCPLSARGRRRG